MKVLKVTPDPWHNIWQNEMKNTCFLYDTYKNGKIVSGIGSIYFNIAACD